MSDSLAKSPDEYAVLPFYATAAIAFFVLCTFLFIAAPALQQHYFHPHTLAMVHTAALGWATMIILGASYQLLPVICERDIYSSKLAFSSYLLFTAGVILLVYAFWNFYAGYLMIAGAALIVMAAVCYLFNVWFTSFITVKFTIAKLIILTAAAWLFITTFAGLLLAVNLRYPFIYADHLKMLKLHAHAGFAGWFLLLIIGVSSKLVPMFLLGKSDKERYLNYSYWLINTGLIVFVLHGLFLGFSGLLLLYAALVFAGVIFHLLYLYDVYRNRVPRPLEVQMRFTGLSFFILVLVFLMMPLVVMTGNKMISVLYGVFIFLGWLTPLILGKTFKTLPFIIWNNRYKNLVGKQKTPLPRNLYNESLVKYQFYLFICAFSLLVAGLILNLLIVIKFASLIWIIVALLYNYNVFMILFHKTKKNYDN